jgi:hypothetical protein
MNPVYSFMQHLITSKLIFDKNDSVQNECKCYMKKQQIFKSVQELNEIQQKHRLSVPTDIFLSPCLSARETMRCSRNYDDNNCLFALYTPHEIPLKTIQTGSIHELSILALESNLCQRLNSSNLLFKKGGLEKNNNLAPCQLYTTTSFFLPGINLDSDTRINSNMFNVCLMSDIDTVIKYWSNKKNSSETKMSNLMYLKLSTPFQMALKENSKRLKQNPGTTELIRHIVIGDINFDASKPNLNSLYCQTLWRILSEFNNCFQSVTICPQLTTRHHFHIFKLLNSE